MARKGWSPFFFSSLSSVKCLKVSLSFSFLLFFLLSSALPPLSSNVILGEATHIRNRMRESLVSLHQQTERSQVGSSSSDNSGGDEEGEDDDDSVLTQSEQDAEDECEAQEVMQQMMKDELEGKGSSLMATSPQWQLLKLNLERSADNQEMCAAARTGTSSSSAPMCRQIQTPDKDKKSDSSASSLAAAATGNDLKCGGRDYELLVEQYIQRNNCLASVVSSHTLAQPWLGHTDPSKASSSSSSPGVEGSAKSEAVARRGIIDVLVQEYNKAMDSKVLDDQLWYIYEEAANILQDFKKGAIQGLNAFNSEEVRKVWVKRRTQQVAILCGLGNGKAAELGTSVIVNEGNVIFRVNLDGADDDAVTAYMHAIATFAREFVRRLLEKGGLVDRAIELHKKFHKFRFFKIQGLLQNSEPSTDVREQNKLMNALPLQKHKKKKHTKKDGKEGASDSSFPSKQQQSPSAFLQIQQTTQGGVEDLPPVSTPPGAVPVATAAGGAPVVLAAPPTAAVTPGIPISSGPVAGVLSSPGMPVVTQDPTGGASGASGGQGTVGSSPSQVAQPLLIPTTPPNNGSAPGISSPGDQSSSSNPQAQQQTFVPLALSSPGQAPAPASPQQVVQVMPGGDMMASGGNPAGQEGGGQNKMMMMAPGTLVVQPPSSQQQPQPPLSPLEEYENRGNTMTTGAPLVLAPNGGGRPSDRPSAHDGGEAFSEGQHPFGGDEGGRDDQRQQRPQKNHLDILQRDSHAELPWKKDGGREGELAGGKGEGEHRPHDDHEGAKAVPIKTKITAIFSRLRMLNMKNDTVQYEPNKELVDSIVKAAYLDMSDRVLDVWASLLPQAAVTTSAQLITILLPKPDVDFAEFYNKTLNADGTITDGVAGQLPVNHTRLVERFAQYVEEIYRDCWRVFFASNDNFLSPPPQPRHSDFSSSGASSYSAGLPSAAGGVSTLEVQQQAEEEKSGVEHSHPSSSASSSLASVNAHSFVSSHASASVESESSSSSFPSVALVASSDGAPINDLTELVTDPEVVEKTAAKSFTAGGVSVFASSSSAVMLLLCTVVAMTIGGGV